MKSAIRTIALLFLVGRTHRQPQPHVATVLPLITMSQAKFPTQGKEKVILPPQLYSIMGGAVPHIGETSGPVVADILSTGDRLIEPLQIDTTLQDYTKETLTDPPCGGGCLPYLLPLRDSPHVSSMLGAYGAA